jgi:arsenate reductase
MEKSQSSKLINTLPEIDIIVTMGCNVDCPNLPCKYREDWGLDDPSEKTKEAFVTTTKTIEDKVRNLVYRIQNKQI